MPYCYKTWLGELPNFRQKSIVSWSYLPTTVPLRSQGWPRKLSNYISWSPWTCAVAFHFGSVAVFQLLLSTQQFSLFQLLQQYLNLWALKASFDTLHRASKELIRLTYSTTSLVHTSCVGLLNPLLGGWKSCYNHGDYPSWDVTPSLRASRSTSWISGCISGFLAASAANSQQSQLGSSEPYWPKMWDNY